MNAPSHHYKFLALTGAGISAASGIPTFQDIPGIKEKLTVEYRHSHRKEFDEAMQLLKDAVKGRKPNAAHKVLAKHHIPIVTMNVDGLHQKAGSGLVVECHGNVAADSVVLYGQRAYYEDAFRLMNLCEESAAIHDDAKILLVIGTSYQTQFAQEFTNMAIAHGWKIVDVNHDAEHRLEQIIQEEATAANKRWKAKSILDKIIEPEEENT